LSWVELSWVELSWVELSWVELSWVELSWVELSWVELSWVELRVLAPKVCIVCEGRNIYTYSCMNIHKSTYPNMHIPTPTCVHMTVLTYVQLARPTRKYSKNRTATKYSRLFLRIGNSSVTPVIIASLPPNWNIRQQLSMAGGMVHINSNRDGARKEATFCPGDTWTSWFTDATHRKGMNFVLHSYSAIRLWGHNSKENSAQHMNF